MVRKESIRLAFGRILWVPLGQDIAVDLCLSQMYRQLSGTDIGPGMSVTEKKAALTHKCSTVVVLLVLDDLWNAGDEEQLDVINKENGSRILVTKTRNDKQCFKIFSKCREFLSVHAEFVGLPAGVYADSHHGRCGQLQLDRADAADGRRRVQHTHGGSEPAERPTAGGRGSGSGLWPFASGPVHRESPCGQTPPLAWTAWDPRSICPFFFQC